MKKKFLVFTLCFTLIFSSLNYKKSYADAGVISLPMLATVSALAVGTGIIINNSDDLYDLGRMFYDYVDMHNDLTWSTVQSVFSTSVALNPSKFVSVDSPFLNIVKGFFDDKFSSDSPSDISYSYGLPAYNNLPVTDWGKCEGLAIPINEMGNDFVVGDILFKYKSYISNKYNYDVYVDNGTKLLGASKLSNNALSLYKYVFINIVGSSFSIIATTGTGGSTTFLSVSQSALIDYSFPYNGGYTWDNVDIKKENEGVALPIPGDLGQLVGQGSTDFWDNTDGLVGTGDISLPVVDNPSIGIGGATSFPNSNVDSDVGVGSPSVPNEGIWAQVKDFIISLVVPSDTFWTDTWGGLYGSFTSSFPMVDMDNFNKLVTGEKKFPNIDINIMGVTGRVVNGDVINSIVDWLRPIVAGFMMLCLMLFNYRKIYKLVRNSEPFGGIAPGTSDFSTGISEYSKQDVVKATDMVAEYRAWRERGGK